MIRYFGLAQDGGKPLGDKGLAWVTSGREWPIAHGKGGTANVGHSGELVLKPVGSLPTLATELRGRLLALVPVAAPMLPAGKVGANVGH